MSCRYIIKGCGFLTDSVDPIKMLRFMKRHEENMEDPDLLSRMLEDMAEEGLCEEDISQEIISDYSDNCTLAALIAPVMTNETGITFDGIGISEDGHEGVILVEGFPWERNEKEKNLTSWEHFESIVKPYMKELGIKKGPDLEEFLFCG